MTPSRVERRRGEIVDDHNGRVGDERLHGLDAPAKPVYVISVAAELAGMHAQTLRQYDRLGLVTPERTGGGGRRYSMRDIAQLRRVQELSSEGVSLAGIQRIMELEHQVTALRAQIEELSEQNAQYRDALESRSHTRVFAAGRDGIVALGPGERPRPRSIGRSLRPYSTR